MRNRHPLRPLWHTCASESVPVASRGGPSDPCSVVLASVGTRVSGFTSWWPWASRASGFLRGVANCQLWPLLRASRAGTVTTVTNNAPAWHFQVGAAWRFACFVPVAGSARLSLVPDGHASISRRTGRRRTGTTLANDTLFEERAPGTLGSTELTNSDQKHSRTDELK